MKILIATDAWEPQVNGVVRTLGHVAREAKAFGTDIEFLVAGAVLDAADAELSGNQAGAAEPGDIERRLEAAHADAIHVATEGPIGHAVRQLCMRRGVPFTTSLHTRFPDYLAGRLPVPQRWTADITWAGCAAFTRRAPRCWRRRRRSAAN